ncbi:hypothetical protein GOQ27_10190 [Clostridium sp. D2Q-11]|uniref:Uncharacterized protein n=1 Tax=Anaeromonas frigoriresistens TaxID=2683708 RepID=A0A942Z9F9_9FIRM|nr:hypothetical protein [Anaeromonas frigoriresistens]MBS4538835.1 hypothetical protein [Anaeromonas frigoriresistens]
MIKFDQVKSINNNIDLSKATSMEGIKIQISKSKSNMKYSKISPNYKEVLPHQSNKNNKNKKKDYNQPIEEEKHPEIKISIVNISGNKNEIEVKSDENSLSQGQLKSINKECIDKIIDTLDSLSKETLDKLPEITIPIYIFNMNNILTSGKKNEINPK